MRRLIKKLVCNVKAEAPAEAQKGPDIVVDPTKVRTLAILSDMDRVLARTRCVVGVHDGQKMVLESPNAGALAPGGFMHVRSGDPKDNDCTLVINDPVTRYAALLLVMRDSKLGLGRGNETTTRCVPDAQTFNYIDTPRVSQMGRAVLHGSAAL